MPHGTKIATCCYCGTRAALVFTEKSRHELSCSACGAPLHNMKMLRSDAVPTAQPPDAARSRPVQRHKPMGRPSVPAWARSSDGSDKKKKKKRKTLSKRIFEGAFDVIEDLFD